VAQVRRLLVVAVNDCLGSEPSTARARTLAYLAKSAAKLLETGELEEGLEQVKAAVAPRVKLGGRP